MSQRNLVLGGVSAVFLLGAASLPAQDRPMPPRTRAELFHFAELLDSAVAKVSRPSPFQLMGPSVAASGYLLPGYGAVFVLPPRALPATGVIVMRGPDGVQPVMGVYRRAPRPKPNQGQLVELPGPPELQGLDRDMQQIESLVVAYAREAELQRREAEEQMERVASELRMRFPQIDAPPPAPASAPPMPAPPSAPTPPAETATLPVPPAPPWRYWFQSDVEGDSRTPDQVVGEVRSALIQALESRAGTLTTVKADDFLVVAVDFAMRGFPLRAERRSERSLVLRAKKRDLDERRSGKLSAEELRKRILADEY